MIKKIIIILLTTFFNQISQAQELWQLTPWAVDSNYIIGAYPSGEPKWVHKDSIGISTGGTGTVKGTGVSRKVPFYVSADSLAVDSMWYNASDILSIGTGTPTVTGGSFGMHIHGNTFSSYRLTNSTTGAGGSGGTTIYTAADSLYISNLEPAATIIGINSVERLRIDANGLKVENLKSGGTAPTTSGTLVKLVSDANGRTSFQTNNTGTVTSIGLATGTTGTDVNVSGSTITSSGTITVNIPTASASNTGKLSATDWSTFNGKIGSLNGLTASTQTFAVSTASAGFGITSSTSTHTFNLPFAESASGLRLGHNSDVVGNGVSVGNNAGDTDCSNCVALGKDVLSSSITGASNNVGIGLQTLYSNTNGVDNMAIGNYSNYYNQTGDYNVGIGTQSLQTNTAGNSNIAIGRRAGFSTTGSENIFIGTDAGYSETGSGTIYIGSILTGNQTNGRVGINTSVASLARSLHVTGEARITDLTTDTPTAIVGHDGDGDLNTINLGTGLLLSGNTLNLNGVGTVTSIATNNGITGGTIITSGTIGLTGNALSLHNLATNGIIARTAANTVTARTITANTAAGEFGLSVSNGDGVSGNPTISLLSNYATLTGSDDQNLTTTYAKYIFSSGSDGDDTGIVADVANDEIDIVTTGLYKFEYSLNCKSNTSAHIVSTRMQNVGTGSALGGTRNHYFDNTNEYCHNNAIGTFNMTAGSSVSLYVKTNSGTPNINDCQVSLFVNRVD